MKIPKELIKFLQDPKIQEYIDNNEFANVYNALDDGDEEERAGLTRILLSVGIDPLNYMDFIPTSYKELDLNLKKFVVPNHIIEIGRVAFFGCENLEKLLLNKGLKIIGDWSFCKCSKLKTLTIPASVIEIGMGAFSGCSGLTTIKYEGTMKQWLNIKMYSDELAEETREDILFEVVIIQCTDGRLKYDSSDALVKNWGWKEV